MVTDMENFANIFSSFLEEFGSGKEMVLSTSLHDKVTSRMMSVVQNNGRFYFQTDKTFRKYNQLVHNKQVALCTGNIQIEGTCRELGHPREHPDFAALYQAHFPGPFKRYSSLDSTRVFEVTPTYVERWIYKEESPFVEIMDVKTQEYQLYAYHK